MTMARRGSQTPAGIGVPLRPRVGGRMRMACRDPWEKPSRLPATLGDRARDSENFSPALDSRKLIGQAQGILMNASTSTTPAPLRSFAATHKTGTSNYETSPQMVVDTLNCPVFHPVDRARTAALARCYAQRPRRGADGRTRPPRKHEHQG
jgi:hypothetical protein